MCGITGYWNHRSGEPIDALRLAKMNDVMTARGPDDEGSFVDGAFGMAARRLSIIDIEGGHQPIGTGNGRFWITYNGEVYNFPELRADLIQRGHTFKTSTDTETVVHLYEAYGPAAVERLNGMFAFAIFDRQERRLFIARDRIGIKPLFYAYRNGTFVFGSDVKSFIYMGPEFVDELDHEAIHHFLSLNYIPAPRSVFKHVKSLLPAHTLTLQAGGSPQIQSYWDLHYTAGNGRNPEELAEELRALLRDSVEKRLIADVPVGVLLSGGIDSSSIAALMAASRTDPIKTFSANFAEDSFSEVHYAREMSRRLGTDHYEVVVGAPDEKFVRQLVTDLGQPYADSSMVPLRHVCELARRHVKVALSGDGGDEVFAGYQTYTAYRLASFYRRLPGFLRDGVIRPLVMRLPTSDRKISFEYKAKRFVSAADLEPEAAHYAFKVLFGEDEKRRLYRPALDLDLGDSYEVFEEAYAASVDGGETLNRLLYVDTKVYLPDDILVKVDRMSMANSLEARVPLLDHRVVEFAAKLPPRLKQNGREGKYLFRRAMAEHLPPSIVKRKKAGFNVPASAWLKGPLGEMVADYLSRDSLQSAGLFEPDVVADVLARHNRGLEDRSRELFGLLIFNVWHRHVYAEHKVGV